MSMMDWIDGEDGLETWPIERALTEPRGRFGPKGRSARQKYLAKSEASDWKAAAKVLLAVRKVNRQKKKTLLCLARARLLWRARHATGLSRDEARRPAANVAKLSASGMA